MMKNVSILLALTVALIAMSVAHAAVEIGSESGSGAINCPGTIDVTADGTYCNGELVPSASSSTTETSSAAQGGFVAATIVGALVAAFIDWTSHAAPFSRKALTPGMLPRNGGLYISRALADDSIAEGGQNFTLQCEDAKAMLDSKTCVFVDMRSEKAYDYEHITKPPRMTVNIPYHQGGDIEDYAALIQRRYSNTNTGLLLVCEDGDIGIATADILQGKGYARVYGVEGGYQGWMQKFTTSGRRRIGGKFVSSGKEALKSGLNLDSEVASTYEENWGRPDLSLPSNRSGQQTDSC